MKKCSNCGNEAADSATYCDYCGSPFPTIEEEKKQEKKKSNVAAGAVGALIGAVIGGASIILVSRLGFVAAICGLILAVCTLKGYEIMGGSLNTIGVIICVVLMLITPYIADRLDWALLLMEDYKATYNESLTLGFAFSLIPELINEGAIESSNYWGNLAQIYLFTLLGGASSVISAFKKK